MLLAVSVALYARLQGDWRLFAELFLVPDLSFVAYLFGPRAGAVAYNAMHSTIGPLVLLAPARFAPMAAPVALIWLAHVGLRPRARLRPEISHAAFAHTHLGRIGRAAIGDDRCSSDITAPRSPPSRSCRQVPLWLLFVAVQWLDVVLVGARDAGRREAAHRAGLHGRQCARPLLHAVHARPDRRARAVASCSARSAIAVRPYERRDGGCRGASRRGVLALAARSASCMCPTCR